MEFLWVRPFREMTVAELMSITGISRSAFYQYFNDLHELMETLLQEVAEATFAAAEPWFSDEGEHTELLKQTLSELVDVGHERGPILRAVVEASTSDARLERAWAGFLKQFDDAVCEQIEKHQDTGLIPEFDAHPVTVALNRL
ncbi:MAG: TetR/AcrR family transcriptional regulator, partial [Desulfuromonadales bacterium]|nr:TetR/AcrR family transcriptional regulator [Desulfuromonadales bacterium]